MDQFTAGQPHACGSSIAHDDVAWPAAALAFVRAHPAVVSTVVGARGADQVSAFLEASRTPVPVELWAELREAWLLDPMAPVPHASLPDISI